MYPEGTDLYSNLFWEAMSGPPPYRDLDWIETLRGHPTQVFPVNVNPRGNQLTVWYPWDAGELKELRKAIVEDGSNSPSVETVLDRLVHRDLVTKDWLDLAKAVLTPPSYIKWTSFFKEECLMQVEMNQAAEHQMDITLGMLFGSNDRYATGVQQASLPAPYRDQVRGWDRWLGEGYRRGPLNPQCQE